MGVVAWRRALVGSRFIAVFNSLPCMRTWRGVVGALASCVLTSMMTTMMMINMMTTVHF